MNNEHTTIQLLHHRPMRQRGLAIACAAFAMACAVPAHAQGETRCSVESPDGWFPLRGVNSFSASVTQSYAGTNPCLGGNPPQPCSGFCHSEVSGLVGKLQTSYCRVWFPVRDPASQYYPGYWCEPRVSEPLFWVGTRPGTAEQGGTVTLFGDDPAYPDTTGSVNISFSQPVRATWFLGRVSGGRVLHNWGNDVLYVHAGEAVALESAGSRIYLAYGLCPDADANGICDEYDDAARAFGDFDSSGSIDGADLGILLAQWGPNTPRTVSDLDRDGFVNGADLGLLLASWGPIP